MSSDTRTPCGWRGRAPLHVLALLSGEESASFEEHLLEGCGDCGAELEQARLDAAGVDLARARRDVGDKDVDGVGPKGPPGMRERLHAQIRRPDSRSPSTTLAPVPAALQLPSVPGVSVAPRSEDGWWESGVPGVGVRLLAEDPVRRYATTLVRMASGACYPEHRHVGREECYVIQGDVSFGGQRLEAGDFQIAEPGSLHPAHSTEGGCLLLVVSCQDDGLRQS